MNKKLPKFNEIGGHFVTTKTYKAKPYFLDKGCCDILINVLDFCRKRDGYRILGYAIMPEHLHLLIGWDVDENKDLTISRTMQVIKGYSAVKIRDYMTKTVG